MPRGTQPTEFPPVLTVREAAQLMRCGRDKAYEMTRRPGFPALRDGWKIVIPRDALLRWIEEQALANTGTAVSR